MPPRFSIASVLASPAGEGFFRGFNPKVYGKGCIICNGEDGENGVFVVMSGKLRVFLMNEDREISLFYLTTGDMFCMHSGYIVETCEKTELRVTDIKTFSQKIESCPAIAWGLVSILGRALTSCKRTIEDLMFHDIKQRIAWFFVDHAKTGGRLTENGIEVSVELTVEQIANLIGSSRQATSTAINSLIKEGYMLRQGRGNYTIPDMSRLKSIGDAVTE